MTASVNVYNFITGATNPITTTGVTTTSGSNLYLVAISNNSGIAGVSDSKGNTWGSTLATTHDTTNGRYMQMFECLSSTSNNRGASHTVTCTAFDTAIGAALIEIIDAPTANASEIATMNSAYLSGSTLNCSVTTQNANDLVLAIGFCAVNDAVVPNGGFTLVDRYTGTWGSLGAAYKVVASASTAADPAWTVSGPFHGMAMTLAIKPTAGTAATSILEKVIL